MTISPTFRTLVLDQLGRVAPPIRAKNMFGGVGIYSGKLFFALIADDELYLKVDDANRPDFEARGIGPFRPYGPDGEAMQYYPVPGDVLEDAEVLGAWVQKAMAVAQRARGRRRAGASNPVALAWMGVIASVLLVLVAACSADPTRVLPLVPAEPGSLDCARRLLDERGYDARVSPDDPRILDAERREGQLGTDARREIIRVRWVADAGDPSLRAAVWAVDYHPGFSSRPLAQDAVLTEPSEETVTDAREALRVCSRQRP